MHLPYDIVGVLATLPLTRPGRVLGSLWNDRVMQSETGKKVEARLLFFLIGQ